MRKKMSAPRAFRGKYESLERLLPGEVCYFPLESYWLVNSARLRASTKSGAIYRLRKTKHKVAVFRAA